MKKPNPQRLAQGSKIYLRKASPIILSGLGAAGVIVTSVLAVRATPKALRKIRADSKLRCLFQSIFRKFHQQSYSGGISFEP